MNKNKVDKLKQVLRRFFARGAGQTLVEYGLIAALFAVAIIGVLKLTNLAATAYFGATEASLMESSDLWLFED